MSDVEHPPVSDEPEDLDDSHPHEQTSRCAGVAFRIIFSAPGLVLLVAGYSVMGALFSHFWKHPQDKTLLRRPSLKAAKTASGNCGQLQRLNVLYERNWTLLVHEQLRRLEGSIVAATKGGLVEALGTDHRFSAPRWSFTEALIYSVTVITTIGHGNLTPRTSEGKIVTMLYALVGVPLMLLCLSSLGGRLAEALQYAYMKVCPTRSHGDRQKCREKIAGDHPMDQVDSNSHRYDALQRHKDNSKYEESCHLIRNSPTKTLNSTPHSSPMKSFQGPHQTSPYPPSSGPIGGNSVVFFPANTLQCQTHFGGSHQMPVKYHGMMQIHQTTHFGPPNASPTLHTATVHGLGRSKFVPKPLPQEINMLLAECDINYPPPGNDDSPQKHPSGRMETVDEDDDEETKSGCAHDTPSRVPLISCSRATGSRLAGDGSGLATPQTPLNESDVVPPSPQVPLLLVLTILASYIALGTIVFSLWENWSLVDGAYFCFVTLSTIGFGDLVPRHTLHGPDLQLAACCAYIMLGLVLVAMCFSLVESQLMWRCRRVAVRLKLTHD
uniref:Potassium channel domain-containing protein n=2 Tax=Lutzomyia longipalpis TaxID=7200 RepID=A0A1B0CHU6_LUTLO